ncbi:MAG TPA: hypothetical protein VFE46_04055 [Pirellulales bacterium]|jgi:hypothetical protein|nr:hypothetical protein [Pirellulales bacterium]
MKILLGPLFAVATIAALTGQPPVAELSNLTATAILGWYTWYTATKTIPQLVHHFRNELAAERGEHRIDRNAFLCEMASQRAQRLDDAAAMTRAVNELAASIGHLRNTLPENHIPPNSTFSAKGTS